jgi:threonine synthase
LVEEGTADPGDIMVCVLTGIGLKTKTAYADLSKIPTIPPIDEELEAALGKVRPRRF